MSEFAGKVVLVTGAGLGFGRSLALAFAREGASVAINDLTPINLDTLVDEIAQAGGRAQAFTGDISKKLSLQAVLNRILDTWPRIDVLVNHAAVRPAMPLLEMDEWDWRRVLDVNLTGTFLAIQSVGRVMREQGGGAILNVGPYADDPGENLAAYRASKAGVLALTQAAAEELAPYSVRVNAISPSKAAPEKSVEPALALCRGERSGEVRVAP